MDSQPSNHIEVTSYVSISYAFSSQIAAHEECVENSSYGTLLFQYLCVLVLVICMHDYPPCVCLHSIIILMKIVNWDIFLLC